MAAARMLFKRLPSSPQPRCSASQGRPSSISQVSRNTWALLSVGRKNAATGPSRTVRAMAFPSRLTSPADGGVRPTRTLWLLVSAHAVNHAIAVLLPLVYLQVIRDMRVDAAAIAILTAIGSVTSGLVQLAYSALTRFFSRRGLLTAGGSCSGAR
jgi:hypothetical protein